MIYSDDFQAYAVGTMSPIGSLTQVGLGFSTVVSSPAGIMGKAKCVQLSGPGLLYNAGALYSASFSVFVGWQFTNTWGGRLLTLASDNFELCAIEVNADATLKVTTSGGVVAVSLGDAFYFNRWYWFQINLTFSNSGGFVQVTAEVAVGEKSICSGSLVSVISTASLSTLGVNKFTFNSAVFGLFMAELSIDSLQAIGTDPNPGTPSAHVTQGLGEVAELPSSALLRVSQAIGEVAELPTTALLRVSQGIIEIAITPGIGWRIYEA